MVANLVDLKVGNLVEMKVERMEFELACRREFVLG